MIERDVERKSRRRSKITSLIQEEAARFVEEDVDVPAGAIATVTHVSITPDGARADIFVSLLPPQHIGTFRSRIQHREGKFNARMRSALRMKKMPRMQFVFDDAALKQAHIERLLEQGGL